MIALVYIEWKTMNLRKQHNKFKRNIIDNQHGLVLDVGSGQGGDIAKYSNATRIEEVHLLDPQMDGERGKILKSRLSDNQKFRLFSGTLENHSTDNKYNFINMFFCTNFLELENSVVILDKILEDQGEICGIGMFEEDVRYGSYQGFSIKVQGDARLVDIDNSYVRGVQEKKTSLSKFNRVLGRVFVCWEIRRIPITKVSEDEKLLNSMYTFFRYKRYPKPNLQLSFYFNSGLLGLEVELRHKIKDKPKIINLGLPRDNSYDICNIYNSDSNLRIYSEKVGTLKTLLLRVVEDEYKICVSVEKSIDSWTNLGLLKIGRRSMKRYTPQVKIINKEGVEVCGIILYISKIDNVYEVEVEYNEESKLIISRMLLATVVSGKKFNMPTLLPRDKDYTINIINNFTISSKLDGERYFMFCKRGIGIWMWNRSNTLKEIQDSSCVDIVIDIEVVGGKYIALDLVMEGSFKNRIKRLRYFCKVLERMYDIQVLVKYDIDLSELPSDGYILTSPNAYNNNIYKYKSYDTVDIRLRELDLLDKKAQILFLSSNPEEGRIYEVTLDGEIVRERKDKVTPNSRETIKSTLEWNRTMREFTTEMIRLRLGEK